MKTLYLFLAFTVISLFAGAQTKEVVAGKVDPKKKTESVEAACGECQLGLNGKDCELAVRINGKAYYVDGFKIDDFGDAHGKYGFCNAVRKAEVQGELVDGRYKATYFKLLPPEKKKK
jgi:hypothetical protein